MSESLEDEFDKLVDAMVASQGDLTELSGDEMSALVRSNESRMSTPDEDALLAKYASATRATQKAVRFALRGRAIEALNSDDLTRVYEASVVVSLLNMFRSRQC